MDPLIINILLGISFLTTIGLATFILLKSRDFNSKIFSLTSYAIGLWIASSFLFYNTDGPHLLLLARVQYAAGIMIFLGFLVFSYSFLGRPKEDKKLITIALALSVFFIALSLFTDELIRNIYDYKNYRSMEFGSFYHVYSAYLLALISGSFYYLSVKHKAATDKLVKAQISYVVIGSALGISIGFFVDIFLPLFGRFDLLWWGPISASFFVVFASYAILRHHLFNIKAIGAELLVFAILIVSVLEVFAIDISSSWIFRSVFFMLIGIFCIFLIRSINREVKQREENEALAQQLSNFVSFVTHELRGPVTKFKWKLLAFLGGNYGKLPAEAEKQAQHTFDLAVKMGQNIESFLSLNKLKVGKLELVKQDMDLQDIVASCLNEFEGRVRVKKIEINFERADSTPLVSVDKFQISHIIDNLIDNAIKYTSEGGKISIRVRAEGEDVVFSIKDTGIGISENVLPLLFHQYERGAEETKVFAGGSGIGLYLAKKIVELHGGKIWAESEGKNKGSKFSFSLPRADSV